MRIMKKLRRILTMFCLVMLMVASLSMTTKAATKSGKTGSCKWTLDGTTLTISGNGKMADYESDFPANGGKVSPWINEGVTKVIIKKGVTNVGAYAFGGCGDLKSVTLPNGIESIGEYGFSACPNLKSIKIPSGVKTIGERAFHFCLGLESVSLPSSVKSIGRGAFEYCENLENITLPSGLENIGEYAFQCCGSLESITIPSGTTRVEAYAFWCCTSLKNVSIKNGKESKSFDAKAFYGCESLKSITIPKSVSTLGYRMFENCKNLKTVIIPQTVTWIGDDAFKGCSSKLTLTCASGSTAHTFAKKNHIKAITAKLSASEFTYNGKVKTPTVTVTNASGKKLTKNKDYTVTYASGRKKVGVYSVKITFKGNYTGAITLTFKINPKATTLKKVTGGKEYFTVQWNKQANQTSGYVIQYCKSSNFKEYGTWTVRNNKKTSEKVYPCGTNKKYYVRICTYKMIGDEVCYSSWSSAKAVTIK